MPKPLAADRYKERNGLMSKVKKALHITPTSVDDDLEFVDPSPNPVSTSETPSQEKETMSKPSSYFAIKEHTFKVAARGTGVKGQKKEVQDLALYYQEDIFAISYRYGIDGKAEGTKYIRLAQLQQLASILDKGYPEDRTFWKLDDEFPTLAKELKQQKILALDFLKFITEEMEKNKPEKKERKAGEPSTRTTSAAVLLASIINKNFNEMTASNEPDIEARFAAFQALVTEENLKAAQKWLEEKLSSNKWNTKEFISITDPNNKKQKKNVKNPAYGQVWLQQKK